MHLREFCFVQTYSLEWTKNICCVKAWKDHPGNLLRGSYLRNGQISKTSRLEKEWKGRQTAEDDKKPLADPEQLELTLFAVIKQSDPTGGETLSMDARDDPGPSMQTAKYSKAVFLLIHSFTL